MKSAKVNTLPSSRGRKSVNQASSTYIKSSIPNRRLKTTRNDPNPTPDFRGVVSRKEISAVTMNMSGRVGLVFIRVA